MVVHAFRGQIQADFYEFKAKRGGGEREVENYSQ